MTDRFVLAAALLALSSLAAAQAPANQLAKPPANARHYIIKSVGGKHGDSWAWVTADGTRRERRTEYVRLALTTALECSRRYSAGL